LFKEIKPDKQEKIMKKVLLALLLTVVFAVPAFSEMNDMSMQSHGEGQGQMMAMGSMEMGGDMMFMEHASKMGLTDEQMEKMKPLHSEMKKKQIRSKADLKIAEIELMEIMEVKDFDLDRATAAVKKIEDIKTAQHLGMLKAMKDMRAILTDEQFKNMQKMCMMKMGEEKHEKKMDKSDHKKQNHKKTADDMKGMKH
jgi:Spy/CpxP family protein refolding chaperone